MNRGPQIPWKTRLGMIGETQVKTRLAYFSIPTKYEIDPGIDFYCELLENNSPSLPFYIQAKGTEHFDDNWGQSIRKSTLVDWLQQPFPVFLLVYDETEDVCHWMSVEQLRYHLIEQIFTTDAATVYLRMDRSNLLERGRDSNQSFIEKIKEDTALVQLFRGQALFRGDGYVKQLPSPPPAQNLNLRESKKVYGPIYTRSFSIASRHKTLRAPRCIVRFWLASTRTTTIISSGSGRSMRSLGTALQPVGLSGRQSRSVRTTRSGRESRCSRS
jgi:Domain of unknown function (DUF4365)